MISTSGRTYQIVDASVVVAALLDSSPDGVWALDRLGEGRLLAPHLMPFEVTNIVRRSVARGAVDPSGAAAALADLDRIRIELVPYEALSERIWQLRENLTSYDAAYAAAAELSGGTLVTLDRRLSGAPGLRCEVVVGP